MPFDAMPPNGIDRADGTHFDQAGFPIGSATPSDAVDYLTNNPPIFEELPDSPEIERAEQGTIQHRFKVDRDLGLLLIQGLGRGTFQTDSFGNITRVVSARLNWQKPDVPILTVTSESISFDTPPDEFSLQIIELNPALEKHPRYAFLSVDVRNKINQAVTASQMMTQTQMQQYITQILPASSTPPPVGTQAQVSAAALELLTKRRIGEDTFYLPGFRVVWSQFFYRPVALNPGGYIGDPIFEGLPYFFWSTNGFPDGPDIFSLMAQINPQLYTLGPDFDPKTQRNGISWLRQADTYEFSRTWFKITRSWHGAPYAHWDADIYSQQPSPYPLPPPLPLS